MNKGLLLAIVFLASTSVFSQTLISGVINDYIDVTAVNPTSSSVTVSDASAFSNGDRVLLIQMKGATIDETDSPTFGTISDYNDAGNYEFHTICNISGTDLTFTHQLVNTYDVAEFVQLVRVPVYEDATISGGDLTADPWNGMVGGILALEVTGTLDFGTQNIDVEGLGFAGGAAEMSGAGCSGIVLDATYYSAVSSTNERARKGEGIAQTIFDKECGRGPQANGGGGGNNHNAGGCGGGNYAAGGAGGQRVKSSAFTCGSFEGVESKALSTGYNTGKIFLGGGGGAGHGNNAGFTSEEGCNGGGIVIIKAGTINGNGQLIDADGNQHSANANSEGGGGGGGAGAVLLDVGSYTSGINVDCEGGNGTDTDNVGSSNCNGPGGGGGGGVVWASGSTFPTDITASVSGGIVGVIASTSQPGCSLGSSNLGTSGLNGATLTGLVLVEGTTTTIDTSVTESSTMLTANAVSVTYQWVECPLMTPIAGETSADFTPSSVGDYAVIISDGVCTDTSGCHHFELIGIEESQLSRMLRLYPNPTEGNFDIDLGKQYNEVGVLISDPRGRIIMKAEFESAQLLSLELNGTPAMYFVVVIADGEQTMRRLSKE